MVTGAAKKGFVWVLSVKKDVHRMSIGKPRKPLVGMVLGFITWLKYNHQGSVDFLPQQQPQSSRRSSISSDEKAS
jgi:hypothetical protein